MAFLKTLFAALKSILADFNLLKTYKIAEEPIKITPEPIKPPPTPETMQQMVKRVCKEEGLSLQLSTELYATVRCESNFNPKAFNHNKDANGKILSSDWGIVQVNDYWHIGPGKSFPSKEYVLNNPEACVRWMAKMFKAGKANLWVCHSKGMYKQYL